METLPETTLAEFIRYNNWANQQVLEACQKLTEEQLEATLPGGYGTISHTLAHIVRAESFYLNLLTGSRPQPPFKWEDRPTVTEMRAYATQVGDALAEAMNHIRPTDPVCEEDEGHKFYYRALVLFIQIINHGIEHRTNITMILNAGQHNPPGVDGWGYLSAYPERFDYQAS